MSHQDVSPDQKLISFCRFTKKTGNTATENYFPSALFILQTAVPKEEDSQISRPQGVSVTFNPTTHSIG